MGLNAWPDIQKWVGESDYIFIKKLARNDCSWADGSGLHQSGIYIPREIREAGFFPALTSNNPDKPHIFDARFLTFWPATGETKRSALKHYSNKGSEMHFTRVPRDEFSGLTPASWLLGGRLKERADSFSYWFRTIDSASDESQLLESAFDLDATFHFGVFSPDDIEAKSFTKDNELIAELSNALREGRLPEFVNDASNMPSSEVFARMAQDKWLSDNDQIDLNPFRTSCPGDAIMSISRDIEYSLYKNAELRYRAAQALNVLASDSGGLASAVVRGFPSLDAIFLSAAQTRKSRAGRSFEQHIGRLFEDAKISYQEQAIISSRRPDFVLPDIVTLKSHDRDYIDAMIVSLKTTLRERWKQLSMEHFNSAVILATVDDRVSSSTINDMENNGIQLMVPESLKHAKETCYDISDNVITFREFFDYEIGNKRPSFISR